MNRLALLVPTALAVALAPIASASGVPQKTVATITVGGDTTVKVAKVTATSFKGAGPYKAGIVKLNVAVPATTLTPKGYTTTADCWYPTTASGKIASYNVANELPPLVQFIVSKNPAAATIATYPTGAIALAAPATGKFPLVLFSHGFSGFKDQSSNIVSHLSTWGYVVCSADHPGRDLEAVLDPTVKVTPPTTDPNADINDMIALRNLLTTTPPKQLKGHVDTAKVVVLGHSAGGSAAERLASWGTAQAKAGGTNWIKGWIGMAGESGLSWSTTVAPFNTVPSQPGLVLSGQNDTIVPPAGLATAFGSLTAPSNLVEIAGIGHNAFSDICLIGKGNGGVLAIAKALGVDVPTQVATLATDGCVSPDLSPLVVLPLINQLTVAATRHFLGQDASTAGFVGVASSYPGQITTTLHN